MQIWLKKVYYQNIKLLIKIGFSIQKVKNNLSRVILSKTLFLVILTLSEIGVSLHTAQAQEGLPWEYQSHSKSIPTEWISILPQELAIESLQTQPFIPIQKFVKKLKVNQTYWLKIAIPKIPEAFFIGLDNWSEIEIYQQVSSDKLESIGKSGHFVAVSERIFPRHEFIGPLNPSSQNTQVFYIKVMQRMDFYLPKKIQVSLWSEAKVEMRERDRLFHQGIFLGIIFVMALYNFLIYLSVRDISFLYYVWSIIGVGLYFMFYEGFLLELVWVKYPVWNAYSFAFIVPFTRMAWVLFTQSYLNMRQLLPRWHRFLNLLILLYSVPILTGLLTWLTPLDLSILTVNWIGAMGIVVLSMMLAMGYMSWKKGFAPARYFLLANLFFSLGSILFILREINLIADTSLTRYSVQFGVILQVLLFSLGLADRLNKAREEVALKELEKEKLARDQQAERQKLIEAQKVTLEQEVALQTADLKEKTTELETIIEKLRYSEQKLKSLNDLKDKFFSIISHDLKSPIATLHSFLNILINYSDKISPEEFQKLSSKTQKSVESLSLLLDNLLQWAMTQMEQVRFQPEEISIEQILQDNIELLLVSAESKQIIIQTDFPENATVKADKNMLSFILRNLLNNALKFTPSGGNIRIQVRRETNHWLMFEVIDNGIGMEESQLRLLFAEHEVFTTKGTAGEKGTGLGLLLCKEFVEKNGGEISVQSQTGKGTIFSFKLPEA